jgi:hypothetical protein
MSKKVPPVTLSKFIGGINTTEAEGRGGAMLSPERAVDHLNVEEKDGYLKRRPAFKAICHGPQFEEPGGSAITTFDGTTFYPTRQNVLSVSNMTSSSYLYFGAEVPFNGINIPYIINSDSTAYTAHRKIKVEFASSNTEWTELGGVVDFTVGRNVDSSGNVWLHTLTQSGTIVWHMPYHDYDEDPTSSSDSWGLTTPTSPVTLDYSRYWIRLSIVDGKGVAANWASSTATTTCGCPGIKAITLSPVNSILSAKTRAGHSAVFFGGDRTSRTNFELGGNISAWKTKYKAPKVGFKLLKDDRGLPAKGTGVYHAISQPGNWMESNRTLLAGGARCVFPDDFSTGIATDDGKNLWIASDPIGGPPNYSLTNRLVKLDQSYEWFSRQRSAAAADPIAQFRGAKLYTSLTPASVSEDTTLNRDTFVFSNLSPTPQDNALKNCTIRVETAGATALDIGEERHIISNTTSGTDTTIVVYRFSTDTPTTACTFHIYAPHAQCRLEEGLDYFPTVYYNTPQYLQFDSYGGNGWAASTSSVWQGFHHFYLGKEAPWTFRAGEFWNNVFDPTLQKFLFVNGKNGVLTWDGRFFESLVPNTDPNSAAVQTYLGIAGAHDDETESNISSTQLSKFQLRSQVPNAQFIESFMGKVVLADSKNIYWSVANDSTLWPLKFEDSIRDSQGSNITGMSVLGNALVVYTPTSVWAAPPPGADGMFSFQIESTGIGFASHRATHKIFINNVPSLIGPTQDGVRIYSVGADTLVPVTESWEQLVPGGINKGLLSKSVAALSKFENRYYLAVARAGRTHLDTILVFDFTTKAWWVWRYPCGGISAIGREYDELGNERMLFGGIDGIVSIMVEAENDDTSTFSGSSVSWYAKSPPLNFKGQTIAPMAIMLRADESFESDITVSTYLDGRISTEDSTAVSITDPATAYGDAYGSSYSAEGDQFVKINLLNGQRCTSFQYMLSGTTRFKFKGAELLLAQKGQRSKQ